MRRVCRIVFVVASVCGIAVCSDETSLTSFVNPYIGVGGDGFGISEVPVGPQVPFGALRINPDTSLGLEPVRIPFDSGAGYYYNNNHVECFSHTSVDGAGDSDWLNFGVTVTRELLPSTIHNAGYKSAFTHEGESAAVGYYGVNLDTPATFAEVTACGTHTGRHRYTCRSQAPLDEPCFLILDACHVAYKHNLFDFAQACESASIGPVTYDAATSEYIIAASVHNSGSMTGRAGGVEVYFTMRVAAAFGATGGPSAMANATVSYWENGTITRGAAPPNGTATTSQSLGVALEIPASAQAVVFDVAAAISFVSPASAVNNMHATLGAPGAMLGFEACRAAGVAEWEGVLGQVAIAGTDALAQQRRDELVVFYTAAYHAHLSPTTYTEANGEFMGFDGRVHTLPGAAGNATGPRHVSDLSLWDTFRSHAPLMVLLQPDMARDTVNSMLSMYELGGDKHFPVWPMANMDTGSMVGIHGTVTAADAIRKRVRGIDVNKTFAAIVHAISKQSGEKLGPLNFEAFDGRNDAASDTLDYALDAGNVQHLAEWMGYPDTAAMFSNYSQSFRNVWNDDAQAFCPRYANGTWACQFPFTPYGLGGRGYTEGDSEQYRWYVQHDPYGLVSLYRSRDEYATQLYRFHADALLWPFNTTLPNPFFWAGNEPTFFTPFQFAYAGNEYAHLTQKLVPVLNDAYFFNGPAGIPGNDDYGAMSSWVMFGYLGLYPAASSNNYTVFVPRFDNVTLRVSARGAPATPFAGVPAAGGAVLQLVAHGRPAAGTPAYLGNASVNGVPLAMPFVTHDELVAVARNGGGVARIDFYLCGEATVFGAPAPSAGGPQPWQPPLDVNAGARVAEAVHKAKKQAGVNPAAAGRRSSRPV